MPYMFSDEPERIDFVADAGIVDQIIDWFGNDIRITKTVTMKKDLCKCSGKPECDGTLGYAVYQLC